MPKPIDILDECADEIAKAYKSYEKNSQELGLGFLETIERSLENLIANPEMGSASHRRSRKIVLTRFPYILYYIERSTIIQLVAFMHAKRDPKLIKSVIMERDYPNRT